MGLTSEGHASFLVFTAPGLQPAAKAAGHADVAPLPITVSDGIGPEGGKLTIKADGPGENDELEIKFQVPEESLEEERHIVMTAQGSVMLSGLVIAFSPENVEFPIPAKLKVKFQEGLLDVPQDALMTLVIQHLDRDGKLIATFEPEVNIDDGTVTVKLLVHTFSTYSLPPGR